MCLGHRATRSQSAVLRVLVGDGQHRARKGCACEPGGALEPEGITDAARWQKRGHHGSDRSSNPGGAKGIGQWVGGWM
eukprot:7692619-Alexandrium_andersonii.AAC.1